MRACTAAKGYYDPLSLSNYTRSASVACNPMMSASTPGGHTNGITFHCSVSSYCNTVHNVCHAPKSLRAVGFREIPTSNQTPSPPKKTCMAPNGILCAVCSDCSIGRLDRFWNASLQCYSLLLLFFVQINDDDE